MKKAIVIRAFSESPSFLADTSFLRGVDDLRRCFGRARALGFEGVQLFLELDKGLLSLDSPEATLREVDKAAREEGIGLASLEITPLQYSFTSGDPAVRARGREVVARALEVASVLGCPGVLVIPGYVGLPWVKGGDSVRYDLAYDRTLEALRELAPTAERLGAGIFLENIWNMFLLSPLEMRSLIDAVGSKWVGALLDTGNCVLTGFPEQWISILGPRLREVHLKDYRRAVGTVEGFVPLLAGDVNWAAVMQAFREIGYDGFLIAEVFPYPHFGPTMLEHVSLTMDRLLGQGEA